MFKPVNSKVDIQRLERDQLDYWRSRRVMKRTTEEREGAPKYVFYEGPPTANGQPGSHHVLARAFKDMFPRYWTMKGYYSLRRGGWDTHGLPVEIQVQQELGLTSKQDVEDYGVAAFNEKCRANVFRNISDWEKLTERIAFWVDLDDAYVTFTNDYIESVWWVLKQLWDKGLLYKGYKVVPYSPSSGTPLSSHEVSQGYKTIRDPSAFVRFPVKDQPGVYFLAWTTTPWTLTANVALAVNDDIDYVQVEGPSPDGEGTENLILAAALTEKVLLDPEAYTVVNRFKGRELVGQHYNPLYTFLPVEQDYAFVVSGDHVSINDGTGIVHTAPAYGVDDMELGLRYGLPALQTVAADGKFIDAVTNFRGLWFKDADKEIVKDLRDRGLLYRKETYEHSYPHNWRDGTPLMYFARETWFIRTTDYKDKMVELNQTINWVPEHIRDGRFGNWLDDLKEWALGRERFWGTPLPVWADDQTGEMLCVGSILELSDLVGRDLSDLDLHRPYVDDVTFLNPNGSGGTMRRVPEVIDVWFDSGAMQVAQWGYPQHNQDLFTEQHPADYICEAVDQTRGWFYSLHAISAMLFEQVAFKNVICLGLILDENGEKMSKSKGNAVDPWDVLDTHGADAFRWYLYTSAPPGESRRFSKDLVGEVVNKFWSTLWNTYSFFVMYSNLDGWTPHDSHPPVEQRSDLDRWILAELHALTRDVTVAFENYDAPGATRPVQAFVENLSNWYIRLSRRRFWKSVSDDDKAAAYATLHECLVMVAKLIAPTAPFLSEALYRNLVAEVDAAAPDSVHLSMWPEYDETLIDARRISAMATVQRLVSLGRAARESVNIRGRQPLSMAQFVVRSDEEAQIVYDLAELIKSELNVKDAGILAASADVVDYTLNPLPQLLGKKFGKDFPMVQKALRDGEGDDVRNWAIKLLAGDHVTLNINGQAYEVTSEEVEVRQQAAQGYAVAEDNGYLTVLDTTLTDDLVQEGLVREVVRRIQRMRQDADFDIDDKIAIAYVASERLAKAIKRHADYVKAETLGVSLRKGKPKKTFHKSDFEIDNETLLIGVKRQD